MRVYLYYITHSFIGAIKKMLRTWLKMFIAVFALIFIFSAVIGLIFNAVDTGSEPEVPDETEPGEEGMTEEEGRAFLELVVCGITVAVILLNVMTGDKNGASIFNMADVNLLFPSPRKPQSILMFKVFLQLGAILLGSIYLLFQLPNLIMNLGISLTDALVIFAAWLLVLIIGKLISVLVYMLAATYEGLKKFIRPFVYVCIAALAAVYFFAVYIKGLDYYDAAVKLFATESGRIIPVVGWVRGLVMFTIEDNPMAALLCLLGIFAVCGILIFIISMIKVDYYEDAMSHASILFERTSAAAEGRKQAAARKPSKKYRPDGIGRGSGANIFFFKALYQRRYGATLGFITPVMISNLVITVIIALVMRFPMEITDNFIPIGAVVLFITLFTSQGNPISEDTSRSFIALVPEPAETKLAYDMFAGLISNSLDLLPTFVVCGILLQCNPLTVICWYLLAVLFGSYTSAAGLFCDMLIPTKLPMVTASLLHYMIIMLTALPTTVLIILGYALSLPFVFLFAAAMMHAILAFLLILGGAAFLHRGRD